jgi:hypothetical protein
MPVIGSTSSQSGRRPGVPTGVSADFPGEGMANVNFTEPVYKGKGVVTYIVTPSSSIGGVPEDVSSPVFFGGCTPGTAYTFTVKASSSGVTSAESSPSSSVVMPPYWVDSFYANNRNVAIPPGASISIGGYSAIGATSYELVLLDSLPEGWIPYGINTYTSYDGYVSASIAADPDGNSGEWSVQIQAFTAGNTASVLSGIITFIGF